MKAKLLKLGKKYESYKQKLRKVDNIYKAQQAMIEAQEIKEGLFSYEYQ